ncbi:hypothetical protein [Cupriavidus oxalaticus]|jgi:hypothetical protein|uniref:Uncharacterized protein n=1 Tax=Cupriavidus oxalaticus TaxID=96344 RepID=A0A375FP71_9BURK|nr:hypothetical protein [Cupriavidus oxalaticus]QRQ85617.1 hypothetical protein JTE91_06085 [Cupriavidus oxalaticus]QRQ90295.1 hypothetical protein JTE92_06260 [Cupriavidus oxalaticus]WQD84806.1 hypothetical protein U0036_24380 [Cupriavidus oxalaticus]SPC07696.1 hypothetical protein CO2235_U770138 [Cupriavidus oxalaticus]SPC24471.1 hypothetical protein CO2235_MP80351 [Cupriavidus oxalaticus]
MEIEKILSSVKFDPDFDPSYSFELKRISFFDHYLSIDEANACNFIFFKLAEETGELSQYLAAENRLLSLWAQFAVSGRNFALNERVLEIESLHDVLELGAAVIREIRGYPVFFAGPKVIWEPASDLTHLLWVPKDQGWRQVERMVLASGVNFLE